MQKKVLLLILLSNCLNFYSQSDFYLVGEEASVNLNFSDNPLGDKGILFEARPIVRYKFYNNIKARLINDSSKVASTSYLIFSPHIRMYNENSEPIKMPSYQVAAGYQHTWIFNPQKKASKRLLTGALESGHYSNGQSGCAFASSQVDGSQPCNNLYNIINDNSNTQLSNLVNRTNGHFQTNFTSFYVNIRELSKSGSKVFSKSNSLTLTYTLYHRNMLFLLNYGGYSDNDIQIYGKHRIGFSYEFSSKVRRKYFYVLKQHINYIVGDHSSVNSLRSETSFSLFFSKKARNFGIKTAYIFGHDDYNLRFVDDVNQITLGVVFSPFGLFSFNNYQKL